MERLVYREGIATVLDAVRPRLNPRIVSRLQAEAGIDAAASRPSYPQASLDALTRILAEELYRGLPVDEATFQLGVACLKHYEHTLLGKALFPVVRLLGPLRVAKRLPGIFRQTNNYADVKVEVTSDRSWELDHNEVGAYPHMIRGNMHGAGELLGWKNHKCELLSYDGHRARYRMSWT